ncbi:MAG: hypothetical protein ACLTWL_03775 [Eubacterium callanderi]|nr:hypothetical protein [Eubacterium callanderi]
MNTLATRGYLPAFAVWEIPYLQHDTFVKLAALLRIGTKPLGQPIC